MNTKIEFTDRVNSLGLSWERTDFILNDAYRHGQQAETDRIADLRRAALDAEWQGATGSYARVIRQLRYRGNQFTISAVWIYRSLLVVIVLGLAFYLGLPYLEKYADGRRDTLQSQQLAHTAEHSKLDQQRNELILGSEDREGFLDLLNPTARHIPSGVDYDLNGFVVSGERIIIFGDRGSITRSTDGGESFEHVASGVEGDLIGSVTEGQTILLFGGRGVITRSIDGGETFKAVSSGFSERYFSNMPLQREPVSNETDGPLEIVINVLQQGFNSASVDGQTILLFGDKGAISRSNDAGRTFSPVPSGVEGNLSRSIVDGPNVLLFGDIDSITHSSDGGQTFEPVEPDYLGVVQLQELNRLRSISFARGERVFRQNGLQGVVVDGQDILLFGAGGLIIRSTDGGRTFSPVVSGVQGRLIDAIVDERSIILFGELGAVTRSTDGGETFSPVQVRTKENLTGSIVEGQNILLFGTGGQVINSTDGGQTFAAFETGVAGPLFGAFSEGPNITLFGGLGLRTRLGEPSAKFGSIIQTTDGGQTFELVTNDGFDTYTRVTSNERITLLFDGTRDSLFSGYNSIASIANDGKKLRPLALSAGGGLSDAISYRDKFILFGERGNIVSVDESYRKMLSELPTNNGREGDSILARFLDLELPLHIREWAPIVNARLSLSLIEARRGVLTALETETRKELDTLVEAPVLLKQEEINQSFEDFLRLCRGDKDDAELTRACLDGWRIQREADGQSWWQALAVQVPPGVLLLFLLSTLGALYRYSIRMSGFYHSRADALELLHAGLDEKHQASLTALATDLAADKVEFGKGNTPTDQALELAKAIAQRR